MSEEQRKVAIPVTVDGTAAKQGFEQIKADARDMAQAVGQAGQGAGAAMDAGIVAAVKKATAATQEASQQVMSWSQFLKQNMGPAMKEALDAGATHAEAHGQAIRKISAQWAVYKETVRSAGAAAAGAGAAVAQSTTTVAAASDKLTASQARLMSELQRSAVVATQGRSAWLEQRAAMLGVSDAASPYIAKLREAERSQGSLGLSAKQTTAALRQVPMQMTDIVTSLAAGQRPLQVLLQQGGQLKDVFGGIGPAARAMGGYVLGLVNPVTLAAAAVGVLSYAFLQAEKELRGFQNAATLSGNAIGMSAGQYAVMRDSIEGIAGTKGKAAAVLTEIAATGRISADSVRGVAEAAILMERATGQAVKKTIEEFVKLRDEPAKAAAELNRQYGFLTAAVYEQIRALEDQGKKSDAARLAEKTYAEALKERAQTVVDNAGIMEKAWNGVGKAAKWAWDRMLDVGREKSIADQFAEASAQVAKGRAQFDPWVGGNAEARAQLPQNAATMQDLFRRMEIEGANQSSAAEITAANKVAVDAVDAVTKANERGWSKQQQMNKALEEYQANIKKIREANPESALLDPKKIAAAEKAIREQFKEKAGAGPKTPVDRAAVEAAKAYSDALRDLAQIEGAANAKAEDLSKTQSKLREIMGAPTWREHNRQMQEQIIYAAHLSQEQEDNSKAHDDLKRSVEASTKAYEQFSKAQVDAESKGVTDILKRVSDLKSEAAAYGLLESQIARVTLARMELDLASGAAGGEDTAYLRARVDAQRELVKQLDGKELRDANKAAADASTREWERVGDAFVDNLMRGGKSVVQYLKDLFRTLVLRPILAPIGQAMAGAMGTAFGVPAMAQGGAGSAASSMAGSFAGSYLGKAGTSLLGSGTALGNMFAGATGVGGSFASTVGAGLATDAMGATVASGTAAATLGTASTIGSTLMAAAPYLAIGAIVLSALLKKGGGPKVDGQFNPFTNDTMGVGNSADQSQSEAARVAAQAIQAQYDTLATQLGGRLGVQFGVGISADPKGTAQSMVQVAGGAGGVRQFETVNRDVGRSEQDLQAAIAKQSVEVLFTALRSSELDKPFAEFFDSVAESASVEIKTAALKTAGDVATYSAQITDLGGVFGRLADLSVAARGALIEAAGGLQALTQATGAYYENFYSQEEKRQITAAQISRTLAAAGISVGIEQVLGATRAQFRGLVDSLDVTTEAGQRSFAALMQVSGAFASITEAAAAAAESVDLTAAAMLRDNLQTAAAAVRSALRDVAGQVLSFAEAARSAAARLGSARNDISQALFAAEDAQTAAQQRVNDIVRDRIKSIDDFLGELTGRRAESLTSLKARLSATSVLAAGGDSQAQSNLITQAQAVLKAAEAGSTSRADFARQEAFVRQQLLMVRGAGVNYLDTAPGGNTPQPGQLEAALAELARATERTTELMALAQAAGASTNRDQAAGSITSLSTAYYQALSASTQAQNDYSAVLLATQGLQLAAGDRFAALNGSLADLAQANMDLFNSMAEAVEGNDDLARQLAEQFGLTGTAAETLAEMLGEPGTAATTLATLLGASGTSAADLAAALGLTGTAATDFVTAIGTSAQAAGSVFVDVNGVIKTAAGGVFEDVNGGLVVQAGDVFKNVNGNVLVGAGGVWDDVNDLIRVGASGVFVDAAGQLTVAAGTVFTNVNGVLVGEFGAAGAFIGVDGVLRGELGAGGAFIGVNGVLLGTLGASGVFTGVNGEILGSTASGTGARGVARAFGELVGDLEGVSRAIAALSFSAPSAPPPTTPPTTPTPTTYSDAQIRDYIAYAAPGGGTEEEIRRIYDAAQRFGVSSARIDAAMGYTPGTALRKALELGLPAFADGGYHAGGWAMVGERGPEPAYFASPARIYSAEQSGSLVDTERLERLVESLIEEVAALRRPAEATARNTEDTSNTLQRHTHGGRPLAEASLLS